MMNRGGKLPSWSASSIRCHLLSLDGKRAGRRRRMDDFDMIVCAEDIKMADDLSQHASLVISAGRFCGHVPMPTMALDRALGER